MPGVGGPTRTVWAKWWGRIADWRAVKCLSYKNSDKVIKPQYALERLEALTKGMDRYITTEVGQHQNVGRRNSSGSKAPTAG